MKLSPGLSARALPFLLLVGGCSGATMAGCGGCEGEGGTERAPSVLDLVSRLAEDPPETAAEATELLGADLPRDEGRSTAYFDVHVINVASGPFTRAELRVPKSPDARAGTSLMLDLRTEPCVTKAEVQGRFGADLELSVPTPDQPPNAPVYHVYQRPFGSIRFGFGRAGAQCLESVVIRRGE